MREEILAPLLSEVASIGRELMADVYTLTLVTAKEVQHFKQTLLDIERVCFWHKCLIRAFFTQAEGLSYSMRRSVVLSSRELGIAIPAKKMRDLSKDRLPLEKSVSLSFTWFPKLFGVDVHLDTSGEDFRGFATLIEAREAFTHPKEYKDLCPFDIFPSTTPALEWFFNAWSSVLTACATALGETPAASTSSRRFFFRDSSLAGFKRVRKEYDSGKNPGDFFQALRDFVPSLTRDTERALALISAAYRPGAINLECAHRNFLRTLFSQIEGTASFAASHLHRFGNYPEPTKELLIGNHEDVRERLANTLELFSKRFGNDRLVRREGSGWNDFVIARSVRNRITHPQHPQDLLMKMEELEAVICTSLWWNEVTHECFTLDGDKLVSVLLPGAAP